MLGHEANLKEYLYEGVSFNYFVVYHFVYILLLSHLFYPPHFHLFGKTGALYYIHLYSVILSKTKLLPGLLYMLHFMKR